MYLKRFICTTFLFFSCLSLFADDQIPPAAWRIGIGQPPPNPGGRKPSLPSNIDDGFWQGAPVGGFGAGTFSRSYRGNFERWHIKAGVHKYADVPANQFAVFVQPQNGPSRAVVLSTGKPLHGELSGWNWSYRPGSDTPGSGEYAALYPKSWFAYDANQLGVKLTLEQFSPVLPNNYRESSYPVALYNWYAENPSDEPITVSLLFSWTNMIGWFRDTTSGFDAALSNQDRNRFVSEELDGSSMNGIIFDRLRTGAVRDEWDGQFAIAVKSGPGVEVTHMTTFYPLGTGDEVWKPFSTDGKLPNSSPDAASSGEQIAGAIAVKFILAPHEKKCVPMVLSWDLPLIQFGGGRKWVRHYTRYFGAEGTNAWQIAKVALDQDKSWSEAIDAWQKPYITDESKPLWYRGELFNEMYILADGGTVWAHELDGQGNPNHFSSKDHDTFSFLECFDYPFYSTSDVRFYGSFPLIRFWPDIEKQVMNQYADTIQESNPQRYLWSWKVTHDGSFVTMERKVPGAVPHDLGAPQEDPFVNVNQYNYQDVSNWRDLNSKYVLMVWRDYVYSGSTDVTFLHYAWNNVKAAMEHLRQYDTDDDGLIENGGFPDQTYDDWIATGESAYSGGLYLAALRATTEIARKVGDNPTANEYDALFKRSQAAYIKKLWNGTYFNYDTQSEYHTDIMAEQLAGQWYANLTGLGDLVPKKMRLSALKTIYNNNVMLFGNGQMGAVNGIGPRGEHLTQNPQVTEVWTGSTFALASEMFFEGMRDEAFKTAQGVYNVVWRNRGYFFRTPEAYDEDGMFRAGMYMRPGAIWAIEYAADMKKK
ncbi:MAG TPA: non-lysosomal glucosylceramidase [Alloacidobacterium sp.]|nr:non-lysosomal glucosylceramidase [Alloacidobacterium sp.]